MKHFIISVVLILITVSAITINSIFLVGKMNTFTDLLNELPTDQNNFSNTESTAKIVTQINEKWQEQILLISLSVDEEKILEITLLLSDLEIFCQRSDFEMFQATLQRIRVLLDDLRDSEKPLLKSLL